MQAVMAVLWLFYEEFFHESFAADDKWYLISSVQWFMNDEVIAGWWNNMLEKKEIGPWLRPVIINRD